MFVFSYFYCVRNILFLIGIEILGLIMFLVVCVCVIVLFFIIGMVGRLIMECEFIYEFGRRGVICIMYYLD